MPDNPCKFLPKENHNPLNYWEKKKGGRIRIKTREEKGLWRRGNRK
jgi:hypothetical protein